MNIKNTKYPILPEITRNNKYRVFTKHWANLPLHMDKNEMAILSFLTYQAKADNTFKYSIELIHKYAKAIKYANEEYNPAYKNRIRMPNGLATTPMFIKYFIEELINKGWLLWAGKNNVYMINPMLTYVQFYVNNEQYKEMCIIYQSRPADVVEYFMGIVNPKIKSKKEKNNHVYWEE